MRGTAVRQATMLSAVTPDALVPQGHPIRKIKPLVEAALAKLSPVFDQMYADEGRPSIPPEHLLKGCLLIALFSVRSERQFCERLHYDLLFKWFLDLNIMDPAFDHSVFSKNKDRLLEHQVAREFFKAIVEEARRQHLLSEEHFTVDGTLLEAWASMKSFRPKEDGENPPSNGGRNPAVDFRGEQRANDTHASRTDPEARLARKGAGREAKLCFAGHVLMENRHGLVVDVQITQASGTAERDTALDMLQAVPGSRHLTVGADKGYDTQKLCARVSGPGGYASCGPEAVLGHRWADHTAFRIPGESTYTEAGGGDLWLDEDGSRGTQAALLRCGTEPALGGGYPSRV